MTQTWTLESIGRALDMHIASQEQRENQMAADMAIVKEKLITGNGEPPLVEQVHDHQKWISGVNKLIWIAVAAFVGQILLGCGSAFFAFVWLSQFITASGGSP